MKVQIIAVVLLGVIGFAFAGVDSCMECVLRTTSSTNIACVKADSIDTTSYYNKCVSSTSSCSYETFTVDEVEKCLGDVAYDDSIDIEYQDTDRTGGTDVTYNHKNTVNKGSYLITITNMQSDINDDHTGTYWSSFNWAPDDETDTSMTAYWREDKEGSWNKLEPNTQTDFFGIAEIYLYCVYSNKYFTVTVTSGSTWLTMGLASILGFIVAFIF